MLIIVIATIVALAGLAWWLDREAHGVGAHDINTAREKTRVHANTLMPLNPPRMPSR
jgi:hypothetical protein